MILSRIGGIIDRIDCKDNTLRIVDYKTGGDADIPESVESLFIPDKKRSHYVFQTFMYAAIVRKALCEKGDGRRVAPSLLYIHRAASDDYSPVVRLGKSKEEVNDFSILEEEFRARLAELLKAIFNPDTAFTQTDISEHCEYCDFRKLCKK